MTLGALRQAVRMNIPDDFHARRETPLPIPFPPLRCLAGIALLGLLFVAGCSTDRYSCSACSRSHALRGNATGYPSAALPPAVTETSRTLEASGTLHPAGYETVDGPGNSGDAETPESPRRDIPSISMATALRLAAGQNPQVQFALERIEEAFANQQAAEVLWLPSLRAGASYNKHEGTLQETEGNVFDVSRSASFSGLGAVASGTGAPAVPGLSARFHLTDAVFQPRISERVTTATQYAADATTNDTLRDVALAYLNLLQTVAQKAIAQETLSNARQLAELTESFARTGQGTQADADRAQTELAIRRNDLERAEESVHVASAGLSRLLSQDPSSPLMPAEPTVVPIELVPLKQPLVELVAAGLANRPELAENQFLVAAAVQRLRRERYAPLVPSVLLGVSYGGFGGGTGGNIDNFKDRVDLNAAVFWEVRNLGFGEDAARNAAHSRVHQAQWKQVRLMDQVAAEVTEAHAQVAARSRQIETAKTSIESARNAYRRDVQRIRGGAGLPIEALQSMRALSDARREYLRAVIGYDEAQFRLHWAIGWPTDVLNEAEAGNAEG